MNAHAHQAAGLSDLVIRNEATLRNIRTFRPLTLKEMAANLGRDVSNLRKALTGLEDLGLIAKPTDDLGGLYRLTEAGDRALAGIDVAAGRALPADATVAPLTHNQIIPDPDNARTASGLDEDSLQELADTLDRETMLQPPMVRRIDPAVGLYQLVYGERRWRAWGLLIAQGRWPADKVIACRVQTGDKAQADIVALIENLQRTDIDNLEAGESFLRVARAHNMAPQAIATRIGKDPRFVQIAMQVAEKATAEDKAAYRASQAAWAADKTKRTFTWTRLRESVREHEYRPALQLDAKAAAAFGEILLIASRITPDGERLFAPLTRDIITSALLDLTTLGIASFAFHDGVKGLEPNFTTDVRDWFAAINFDADPEAAVERLQAAVVGEMMAAQFRKDGLFVTPAFNKPDPAPALPAPSPRPSASAEPGPSPSAAGSEKLAKFAAALEAAEAAEIAALQGVEPIEPQAEPQDRAQHDTAPPQEPPRGQPGDDFSRQIRAANAEAAAEARIPPMQRLILIELRHALVNAVHVQATMTGDKGVDFGGEFWSDSAAQALVAAGLIITLQASSGEHLVLITDPGDKAVEALGIFNNPSPADLDKARRDAHWPREDGAAYSTAWLNPRKAAPDPEMAATDSNNRAALAQARDLNSVGAAEAEVGRYVYRLMEARMNALADTPEGVELAYLGALIADVEEYGADELLSDADLATLPPSPILVAAMNKEIS